jgi:hypothetical protein
MIPYDDLVVALQAWRAKKGLPIGQMSGSFAPPAQAAPVAQAPPARPPAPPARSTTAKPPPPRAGSQQQAPTTATTQRALDPATDTYNRLGDSHSIGDSDIEHAEQIPEYGEGDDFALAFQNIEAHDDAEGESTAIGSAPAPVPAQPPGRSKRRNDDW